MENKTLEKAMDTVASISKVAANLSETKKETPKPHPYNQSDDNSNKASTGSQTVVVSMEGKKKEPKPIEKHIHEFPEQRPLTEQECDLALKRAQMEYELKKNQQTYEQKANDREWQHKLEMEKKYEKKSKVRRIIAGIMGTIGFGIVGYSIWSDYRNYKNGTNNTSTVQEGSTIRAEGTVK